MVGGRWWLIVGGCGTRVVTKLGGSVKKNRTNNRPFEQIYKPATLNSPCAEVQTVVTKLGDRMKKNGTNNRPFEQIYKPTPLNSPCAEVQTVVTLSLIHI